MAVEKKDKKRKAAVSATPAPSDPPSKKTKKSALKPTKAQEEAPAKPSILKKPKPVEATNGDSKAKPVPVKVTSEPARQVRPRKRAADFLSDDEGEPKKPAPSPAAAKTATSEVEKPSKKKPKKGEEVSAPVAATEKKSAKAGKKGKDAIEPTKQVAKVTADVDESEDEDDQTAALIQGFESSGDEDASGDEGFKPGSEIPAIPDSKQAKRKLRKMKKTGTEVEEPGTVYVGRIPHGFYEHEMRAYFSQFGPITRLRLSRNRTTGHSKHFAFIEFDSASVAQVVADSMNNYLMFGHILKCRVVPNEAIHADLWKGANKRFKKTPWNAIEKRRLDAGKTREQWGKKIEAEEKKRAERAEKMKELGYEFEMPDIKRVEDVPVQEQVQAVDGAETAAAIEAPPAAEKEEAAEVAKTTPKKAKKGKKDTPVKEAAAKEPEKKKEEEKITPKKKEKKAIAADTPEKSGKAQKEKAKGSPAVGKAEKKTEKVKSKGKKAKA
ncbi:hypothetical protein FQN50_006779 [Emmonsiellopsis sp. PD_5]|nr:hypothetical protein FQN50_006779 [Emmonsiellopsis sp. PD_5]